MAFTTPYLQHDMDAFNDIKVSALVADYGFEAYGLLWYIYEMLWREEGVMLPHSTLTFKAISLRTGTTIDVKKFIASAVDYEIFVIDGGCFYSESMLRRLEKLDKKAREISEIRRRAANVRWGKRSEETDAKGEQSEVSTMQVDANTMQNDAKRC